MRSLKIQFSKTLCIGSEFALPERSRRMPAVVQMAPSIALLWIVSTFVHASNAQAAERSRAMVHDVQSRLEHAALERVAFPITWSGQLFAQGRVSHIRSRFREGNHSTNYIAYMWLVAIPVMVAGAISAFYRIRFPDGRRSEAPNRLKKELYREHQLTVAQVRLLKAFSARSEVSDELVLLVRPELFDQAAIDWLDEKGKAKLPQIEVLRDKLFGDAVDLLDTPFDQTPHQTSLEMIREIEQEEPTL